MFFFFLFGHYLIFSGKKVTPPPPRSEDNRTPVHHVLVANGELATSETRKMSQNGTDKVVSRSLHPTQNYLGVGFDYNGGEERLSLVVGNG